jgi:glycine betaine/proline transport system substrate-binding protein
MVGFVIVLLVLTGCGSDKKSDKTSSKPVIKLADMSWLSSEVTTAVAQVLLQEKLGYPVELVGVTSVGQQWDQMVSGGIHVQMEVWPRSSAADVAKYIDQAKTVENGGELGVVGQGGWFVPGYLIDTYPELRTWEGLKDPAVVKLLATAETGDKGRLLSGDPGWVHTQHAEIMIKNLGLNLQVVSAGTEAAELAELERAYKAEEPLLIYYWTPSWVLGVYSLYQVELPPYTDECYADPAQIACSYPPDVLIKALWPGLKDYAPQVYQFLKNFKITSSDQIHMMVQVQIDGKTPEEAARDWINDNERVWKAWIP